MSKESLKRAVEFVGYWALFIIAWAYAAIVCVPIIIIMSAIISAVVFPLYRDFLGVFKETMDAAGLGDLKELYSLSPIRKYKKKVDKRMNEE